MLYNKYKKMSLAFRTISATLLLALITLLPVTPVVSSGAGGGLTDDWDWGAIEALDDTPVVPKKVLTKPTTSEPSQRLSIKESTSPDLQAKPREAYALFPAMPSFKVLPSRKDKEMHPCSNCRHKSWQCSEVSLN